MHKSIRVLIAFAAINCSFITAKQISPVVLHGVVVNSERVPLNRAHVYTVLGEEEAITNQRGEFYFKTNQVFPLKLIIQNRDYQDTTLKLTAAPEDLLIVLKRK